MLLGACVRRAVQSTIMSSDPVAEAPEVYTFDTIEVGQLHTSYRYLSEADVIAFAEITGDYNPIHVDAEYAAQTSFGGRIVHGVFLLSLFSKIIGHDFPGRGSIAVSISCRFLRPVPVNSMLRVEVKISEKKKKGRRIMARTYIYNDANKMAASGEVLFIAPE